MAGFNEKEALRKENERLRGLVKEAAQQLRWSGHPRIAGRMLKAIREPDHRREDHGAT